MKLSDEEAIRMIKLAICEAKQNEIEILFPLPPDHLDAIAAWKKFQHFHYAEEWLDNIIKEKSSDTICKS